MKDTTELCKQAIISKYPQTKVEDWKRTAKLKEGGKVVRNFKHVKANLAISVIFDGNYMVTPMQATVPVSAFPPVVDRFNDFSGRIVWGFGENCDSKEVDFYCGPETKGGYLSDGCDFTSEIYTKIFGRKGDYNAAENYHIIYCKRGETMTDLKEFIRKALTAAGAKRMKNS